MSGESRLSQGELMQLKGYIQEAAEASAEMTRTKLMLELREWQIENSEKQGEIIEKALEKEMRKWFGEITPHNHVTHHNDIAELLAAKRSAVNSLFKKGFQIILVLALLGSLGINLSPAILGSKELSKPKTSLQSTKVE